jgi:hypothetical protein
MNKRLRTEKAFELQEVWKVKRWKGGKGKEEEGGLWNCFPEKTIRTDKNGLMSLRAVLEG